MKKNYAIAIKILTWTSVVTITLGSILIYLLVESKRELVTDLFSIASSAATIIGLVIAIKAYSNWKNQINFDRSMNVIEKLRTKLLTVVDTYYEFEAIMATIYSTIDNDKDLGSNFLQSVNSAFDKSIIITDEINLMETLSTSPQIDKRIESSFVNIYERSSDLFVSMSCLKTISTTYVADCAEELNMKPVKFEEIQEMANRVKEAHRIVPDLIELDHKLIEIGSTIK